LLHKTIVDKLQYQAFDPGMLTDLSLATVTELRAHYVAGILTPVEVVEAAIRRIEALNGTLNAICTPNFMEARHLAAEQVVQLSAGRPLPPLFGIPVTVKDLTDTAGLRTTFGSALYADRVPEADAIVVERLRAAGAILLGKTNTPEFGAGGNTTNAVFGATRNPWNTALTSGGSTGGGAVAVATGMGTLAEGTDLGGSLRTPAAFNGVVGFRTSPGVIPFWPGDDAFDTLWVSGLMGRSVADVALGTAALAGPDARAPQSLATGAVGDLVAALTSPSMAGLRIAFSPDLGGLVPVAAVIREACAVAARRFEALGAVVEEASPDLDGLSEVIMATRSLAMVASHAERVAEHRARMNPNLVWSVERGAALTAGAMAKAGRLRSAIWHRMRSFMAHYDILLTPTASVLPFPVEQSFPTEVDGVQLADYTAWFHLTYAITVLGLPAMSVPCGFAPGRLPVGMQIVGGWRRDALVVAAAAAFEAATPDLRGQPPILAQFAA